MANFDPSKVGIAPSIQSAPIGGPKKASPLPMYVAGALLLASLAIYLFRFQLGGGIWFLVGYLLTPVLSALVLGWDSIAQREGRKDPWFDARPLYSKIIRIMIGVGFVVAIFHICEIGHACGQGFVQSGVFCG